MKDLTGTRVGSYEIVERLGGGGMAVVYRAVQQPLGREVALKALSPELFQDDGFVKRFETEAKTLAKLDHPNILPIYDFELNEGVATHSAWRADSVLTGRYWDLFLMLPPLLPCAKQTAQPQPSSGQ